MKRNGRKLVAVSILFSLLLISSLVLRHSARARVGKKPSLTRALAPTVDAGDSNGLKTTKFTSSRGTITVNKPDDMTAGDTLSGTVTEEPAGKTEAERAQNQDELKGYVVEMENQKAPVSGKTFKWNIPATFAST